MAKVDARLQKANADPAIEINAARDAVMGQGHGGRNVEFAYARPDRVMINVSQDGWAGT